jgi:hypothetical protein
LSAGAGAVQGFTGTAYTNKNNFREKFLHDFLEGIGITVICGKGYIIQMKITNVY